MELLTGLGVVALVLGVWVHVREEPPGSEFSRQQVHLACGPAVLILVLVGLLLVAAGLNFGVPTTVWVPGVANPR